MKQLGGSDLEEQTRQVSPKQPVKQILTLDLEAAVGLLEESTASTGGVTPVVTQPPAGTA
jgi:hypothetical protein